MIKYRTQFGSPELIEVESETEKTVIVRGRREKKVTSWQNWLGTFEEAKFFLIHSKENDISSLYRRIDRANKDIELGNLELEKLKELKE